MLLCERTSLPLLMGDKLLKAAETDAPFTTLREAIGDLPSLQNGERGEAVKKEYPVRPQCDYQRALRRGSIGVLNHEAPRLSAINMQRLNYIQQGEIGQTFRMNYCQKACVKLGNLITQSVMDVLCGMGYLPRSSPSATPLGCFFHPDQNRAFTVREKQRIQSFPDHYVFTGSQAEQYAQVGNAVPPLLALAVGTSLSAVLKEA